MEERGRTERNGECKGREVKQGVRKKGGWKEIESVGEKGGMRKEEKHERGGIEER